MKTLKTINEQDRNVIRSIVITSDPQYPWTPKMDAGNNSESESQTKKISKELIEKQYYEINGYTSYRNESIVLINGDITAYGHPWQRHEMNSLLKKLKSSYYYGLGNHDIENNFNNCFNNRCAEGSFLDYRQHVKNIPQNMLLSHDMSSNGFNHTGSFAYAITFGDFVLFQLNNYPTMEMNLTTHTARYIMRTNLDWLESNFKTAKNGNKIIIVNVHKPDNWKGGPNERFIKLLKEYNVKAVFCGHYHTKLGLKNLYGNYFGNDIPVFLSGSASQKSYLILEQTRTELLVYSVEDNNWRKGKLEKSIEYKSNLKEEYEIITALDNNKAVDVDITNNYYTMLWDRNDSYRQRWIFEYIEPKKAYKIKSYYSRDTCSAFGGSILAWNDFKNSRAVFVTCDTDRDEHYWELEELGDGYYIIKNKKNSNLVLDVTYSNTHNGNSVKVHERNGTMAQKFLLRRINTLSSQHQGKTSGKEIEHALLLNK